MTLRRLKKIFPTQWDGKSEPKPTTLSLGNICLLLTVLMGTALGLIFLLPKPQTNINPSTLLDCRTVRLQRTPTTDVVLLTHLCRLKSLKHLDFLVSSRYFNVEYPNAKWGRLGESEEYFWETKTEKKVKLISYTPFIPDASHDQEEFDR